MAGRRRTYLLQDPYDTDAQQFMSAMFRYFGLRPVCFYTSPKAKYYGQRAFPNLRSSAVERSYDVPLSELRSFAEAVRRDYDVAAVVPYREDTVEVAAELCRYLELPWNPADVVARFRNKHELKTHLRNHHLHVRVPTSQVVRTFAELDLSALPDRFVVKPNNGYGNRAVSIFGRDQVSAVREKLERAPDTTWIVEEFIEGDEFEVDGHVRPDGRIDLLAVLRYRRIEVNGYPTVYHSLVQVNSDEQEFALCEKYARTLMEASGLVGSPFHMEVKIDALGPAMVDLGARLPSDGGGDMLSRMHPTRPDIYAVAAHHYLGAADLPLAPVDWSHYDSARETFVFGISDRHGRIESLRGIEEVEALPEFVSWPVKPSLQQPLAPTTDLRSAPYVLNLRVAGSAKAAHALADRARDLISWNDGPRPRTAVADRLLDSARRGGRKAGWLGHRFAAARFRRSAC